MNLYEEFMTILNETIVKDVWRDRSPIIERLGGYQDRIDTFLRIEISDYELSYNSFRKNEYETHYIDDDTLLVKRSQTVKRINHREKGRNRKKTQGRENLDHMFDNHPYFDLYLLTVKGLKKLDINDAADKLTIDRNGTPYTCESATLEQYDIAMWDLLKEKDFKFRDRLAIRELDVNNCPLYEGRHPIGELADETLDLFNAIRLGTGIYVNNAVILFNEQHTGTYRSDHLYDYVSGLVNQGWLLDIPMPVNLWRYDDVVQLSAGIWWIYSLDNVVIEWPEHDNRIAALTHINTEESGVRHTDSFLNRL